MAIFKNMSITEKGISLYAKAQAGQKINFTKLQIGSGQIENRNPMTLTTLLEPQLDVPIVSIIANSELKSAAIIGKISNKNVKEAMYICELGLFANDPDEGEILYGYVSAGQYGDYYAPESQGPFNWEYQVNASIGNAANVTAEICELDYDYTLLSTNTSLIHLEGGNQKEINKSIDNLFKSVKSDLADITTKQGDLINLKTSNKTNLVSAVNELFQNANNGKNLISSVIGNPLLASDTFQQQSNKIQNLKNTFASNLTSKQQPSNGNESLNNLINKVANINTGKRFATGTRTIAETGTTQLVVQIRGLSFTPSKVIVTGHYLDVRGDDTAFYSIKSSTKDIYERYGRAVYGAHAEVFSHDSCGFDYSETKIVSNGFNIVISDRNTDITLKYWAFE